MNVSSTPYRKDIYSNRIEEHKKSVSNENKTKLKAELTTLILEKQNAKEGKPLTDNDYRDILENLHGDSNFHAILIQLGLKSVSKYSWFSNQRATGKIVALQNFLSPQNNITDQNKIKSELDDALLNQNQQENISRPSTASSSPKNNNIVKIDRHHTGDNSNTEVAIPNQRKSFVEVMSEEIENDGIVAKTGTKNIYSASNNFAEKFKYKDIKNSIYKEKTNAYENSNGIKKFHKETSNLAVGKHTNLKIEIDENGNRKLKYKIWATAGGKRFAGGNEELINANDRFIKKFTEFSDNYNKINEIQDNYNVKITTDNSLSTCGIGYIMISAEKSSQIKALLSSNELM
jgi:hypothetical protein